MAKVVPIEDGKKKKGSVLQFKVSLQESKPEIWRTFQIEDNVTLYALHNVIQVVMNWTNAHLHMFKINGKSYAMPEYFEEMEEEFLDEQDVKIADLNLAEGTSFVYIYDMGDSWSHKVTLEKIGEKGGNKKYPLCLDGKFACPPEDCGGMPGYYEMLKVLKDPKHEEYEDILDWLGDDFDPDFFDLDDANDFLEEIREIPDYDLYEYYEQFDDDENF